MCQPALFSQMKTTHIVHPNIDKSFLASLWAFGIFPYSAPTDLPKCFICFLDREQDFHIYQEFLNFSPTARLLNKTKK